MPATPSSQEQLSTVLDFVRGTHQLLPGEVREIPEGWVVRSPSWPGVWMLNHVRVATEVTYEHAAELCRRYLPDANYDHLYVDHQNSGSALAQRFRQEGWEVDVELSSILSGEPDRRIDTGAVIEAGEDEALALMERWIAEDETLRLTPQDLAHLVEANRVTWRVRGARRLGVRSADGELAAITMLFSDGRIAQLEDVYAIPEARGQGYGRMLVTRGIELAQEGGHELTFIVADDNGWPKQLYRKLGFEPVGRSWLFHRDLTKRQVHTA